MNFVPMVKSEPISNKTYVEIYRGHTITYTNNESLKRVTKDNVVLVEDLTLMEAVTFINLRTGSSSEFYDFSPIREQPIFINYDVLQMSIPSAQAYEETPSLNLVEITDESGMFVAHQVGDMFYPLVGVDTTYDCTSWSFGSEETYRLSGDPLFYDVKPYQGDMNSLKALWLNVCDHDEASVSNVELVFPKGLPLR